MGVWLGSCVVFKAMGAVVSILVMVTRSCRGCSEYVAMGVEPNSEEIYQHVVIGEITPMELFAS